MSAFDLRSKKSAESKWMTAKRLVDYGFHPDFLAGGGYNHVNQQKVNRRKSWIVLWCDDRDLQEIEEIELDKVDPQNNVLKNAPHTEALITIEWQHSYSREQAAYPALDAWAQVLASGYGWQCLWETVTLLFIDEAYAVAGLIYRQFIKSDKNPFS